MCDGVTGLEQRNFVVEIPPNANLSKFIGRVVVPTTHNARRYSATGSGPSTAVDYQRGRLRVPARERHLHHVAPLLARRARGCIRLLCTDPNQVRRSPCRRHLIVRFGIGRGNSYEYSPRLLSERHITS
jgi:hypothetical protein